MVLDHLSHPPLGETGWEPWRTLITNAAANPNVFAKVSGLYPSDSDTVRPFVEFAVELFGPGRLMFGSDWPVAELDGGYERVGGSLLGILGELPAPQRAAILGETARACYGLDLTAY
jgi:L-fuconolactonase